GRWCVWVGWGGRDRRVRRGGGLARLRIRLGRTRARGRRGLFADRLTIVVSEHHNDELRFLGRDNLARHLRPFEVAALVIADQTRICAMLAYDRDPRIFRQCTLQPL